MVSLPSISIVVPARNAQDTIVPCVRSLLSQNYPSERRRIVVVNNRSTDGTAVRLQDFDGAVTIVDENKAGAAAARNAGIRATTTEMLAFMDSDCVADNMWLWYLIRPLASSGVGLTAGAIEPARPDHPIQRFGTTIHDTGQAIVGFDISYAPSANIAVRRSVISEMGCFNEKCIRGEDVDLSWRMMQKGYELIYVPDAVVYHEHETTLTGLFKEGYHHGLGSVQTHKLHKSYLAKLGYRRNRCFSMRRMARAMVAYLCGRSRLHNACISTFEAGKTAGKFAGAIKFRYLDL